PPVAPVYVAPPLPKPVVNKPAAKKNTDWEKFIGENLINKIGILITVIGVVIGMKYSIEHNLINPLTRVVLGYAFGIGVLLTGMKLRTRYKNYSAVLVSGSIAMLYFVTFAAYDFYGLIPQLAAFALMFLFTAFGVAASLHYDLPVIAHLGLVGAYGVPFLLSDGSGRVAILYSYMAIINAGILVISYFKDWKSLLYSSFVCTWLIFCAWMASSFSKDIHTVVASVFSTMFFAEFYAAVLIYKFRTGRMLHAGESILLVLNAFLFYGTGYYLLEQYEGWRYYQGLFTALNAVVHCVVAAVLHKNNIADRSLFSITVGMVITFLTITIPVQLDGMWVSAAWALEAAVLFWIGRSRTIILYEAAAFVLAVLAFISVNDDWQGYFRYQKGIQDVWLTPFFNVIFLSSILVSAGYAAILRLSKKFALPTDSQWKKSVYPLLMGLVVIGFAIITYASIHLEIANTFHQYAMDSQLMVTNYGYTTNVYDVSFEHYSFVLQNMFGLLYLCGAMLVVPRLSMSESSKKTANSLLLVVMTGAMLATVTLGFYSVNCLQDHYLNTAYESRYYHTGQFAVIIRYMLYLCTAAVLWCGYRIARIMSGRRPAIFSEIVACTVLFFVISHELVLWNEMLNTSSDLTKLGMTILWTLYAVVLIIAGIRSRKKHYRVFAIIIMAIALLKLFLYDVASLPTILKTILFVALGVFLLLVSFLYNKFASRIFGEERKPELPDETGSGSVTTDGAGE
ncbi:MAG: DUF2339 domain-containing protein, partial [Candidatus Kapabacteria bacterium]|nr:DUF2339 domain-containing protein [Candidatus Kapabacteria bacterium]